MTLPYFSLGVELSARLAEAYGWSDAQVRELEAAAVFHFAMRAEKSRWQRFDDVRVATSFIHLSEQSDRRQIIATINTKLCGPGVPIAMESTLSAEVREKMEECNRERDEAFERMQRDGWI